jgi:hypothetical protein
LEGHITANLAIPETHAKECISLAYLAAICAQAGLNVRHWKWDDGIDMEIGSSKPIQGICLPTIAMPLQVKATEDWEVKNGRIAFSLKAAAYTRLSATDLLLPQYLVLYTLPRERDRWVVYKDDHCQLFHTAYYMNLAGEPVLTAGADGNIQESKTVHVPVAQRLTAPVLLALFEKICDTVRGWRNSHA